MKVVDGVGLYVRRISRDEHGKPDEMAKRFSDHKLKWVAIGGPWQEPRHDDRVLIGMINSPDVCRSYSKAMLEHGIKPFIWGYPWTGHEESFADKIRECALPGIGALLDPELGSNPTRARSGHKRSLADAHAECLVGHMSKRFDSEPVGLSTYGSGVRMKWFPLRAFVAALLSEFGGRTFVGGQTYTTGESVVDRSIGDYIRVFSDLSGSGWKDCIQLVPNFGLYKWTSYNGRRRAVSKTPEELYHHLGGFIDDAEPVGALIGWAENFANKALWSELERFADQLERGACAL